MQFGSSTQRKRWILSVEKLQGIRESNRVRSLEAIKEFQVENAAAKDLQSSTVGETKKSGKVKALTLEQELKLLKYYASKIQEFCRKENYPDKIGATALLFLKRAYLSFSVLDQDPKNLVFACIYLAGKVEESYIEAGKLCEKIRQPESLVFKGETVLLEALGFDLVVFSPYRPLQGFMMDLADSHFSQLLGSETSTGKEHKLKTIRAKAVEAADTLMLTDAPLLFPPGQLALAALRSGIKRCGESFEPFLRHFASKAQESAGREGAATVSESDHETSLRDSLQQLDSFGLEGVIPVQAQEVQKIDKKLRQCHNVLLDPNSSQYKEAADKQRDQELQRQAAKAAVKRKRCADEEAALLNGSCLEESDVAAEKASGLENQASHDTKRRRSEL